MTRLWLAVPLAWLAACSEAAPPGKADEDPRGPPGGIIEIDPTTIPLGEGTGGSTGGSAGSSGAGTSGSGAGGTDSGGGSAGTSGSSGTSGSGAGGGPVVGTPCETSEECPAPMYCRSDTLDYIGHKQCTMPCDASATCASEFGENSFCIGANVCVLGCTSDADCYPRTHCNTAGWCERGGPGSGVPYCSGTATPCGLQLTALQCLSSRGCTSSSDCTGSARSCLSMISQFECDRQDGCVWISNTCSGSPRSCSLFSGSSTCTSQEGCTWNESCTGTPDACSTIFVALCEDQPGCVLLQ